MVVVVLRGRYGGLLVGYVVVVAAARDVYPG